MQTTIRRKTQLARALGISRPTLDSFVKMDGFPVAGPHGYDLAAVTSFVGEHASKITTGRRSGGTFQDLRVRELTLKCARLQLRLDVEKSLLVEKAKVVAAMSRILPQARQILEVKLAGEFPSQVAGLTVVQAMVYGRRLSDEISAKFRELDNEFQNL